MEGSTRKRFVNNYELLFNRKQEQNGIAIVDNS
jgi:hypothetical protein